MGNRRALWAFDTTGPEPLDGRLGGLELTAGSTRRSEPQGQLLQRPFDGGCWKRTPLLSQFLLLHRPGDALYPAGGATHYQYLLDRRAGNHRFRKYGWTNCSGDFESHG